MISLLLTLIITTTVTPDVEYLGALLCGEACGMQILDKPFRILYTMLA